MLSVVPDRPQSSPRAPKPIVDLPLLRAVQSSPQPRSLQLCRDALPRPLFPTPTCVPLRAESLRVGWQLADLLSEFSENGDTAAGVALENGVVNSQLWYRASETIHELEGRMEQAHTQVGRPTTRAPSRSRLRFLSSRRGWCRM
jgi:hypothetical protein